MEESKRSPHCLILTYPTVGHINPMLQFSKRLAHKGAKVTVVLTEFMRNKPLQIPESIAVEAISDGFDEGGMAAAESFDAHYERFWQVGPESLTKLLQRLTTAACDDAHPVSCVVYDAFLPWALDVAKGFGLPGAVFFTQSCAVDSIYYHINKGLLKVPVELETISIPGLPALSPSDLPSFVTEPGLYLLKMVVDQFSNVDRADWILCNSFSELEQEVANWLAKIMPLRTIGPTIPSKYLDQRLQGDTNYALSISNPNSQQCLQWLNSRPKRSVVYVSFGSLVEVKPEQINEVACWLKASECHFLWVVRASESEKLPGEFAEETRDKGLVVSWCPQLEVLANEAVGCFVTHCGWNSTLEALSLGVPMIAVPQWSDQSTNAKHIADVWKVGLKAEADEEGIVRRSELERCLNEIMVEEGEGKKMRMNALKLSELAKETVNQGGTSDKNIDDFLANIQNI